MVMRMTRRNSPNQIQSADDLQLLGQIVVDKRQGKRAHAKRSRRNRHYEKQFMRNAVARGVLAQTGVEPLDSEA